MANARGDIPKSEDHHINVWVGPHFKEFLIPKLDAIFKAYLIRGSPYEVGPHFKECLIPKLDAILKAYLIRGSPY